MHYSAPVYRPPREANSILLEVTVGCTHNECEFCYVYRDIPFKVASMEQIEEDLIDASVKFPYNNRIYLVGANPYVLSFQKLKEIALMIKRYLPNIELITTFARISDFKNKTVDQLKELKALGMHYVYVGTESGDDETLESMKKGITSADSLEQLKKLEEAGIKYFAMYLTGLGGKGSSERSALKAAELFNQLHPRVIGIMSLTIYDNSPLKKRVEKGEFIQASELELIQEITSFIQYLDIDTTITTEHIISLLPFRVKMPEDKKRIVNTLLEFIKNNTEDDIAERFDRQKITSI